MLITTTDNLEGFIVDSYLGPIVIPVIGAGNFVKDWLARFTDFFGGKSTSYQKTYNKLLLQGISLLREQARQNGANAVINLRIETTNISAGKSLISLILYGTAVVITKKTESHAYAKEN